MKKSIQNIGKALTKSEQKAVLGGYNNTCGFGSSLYIAEEGGNCCAYPDAFGGACYGDIVNNQYCRYTASCL
jgi:hypothetical protein